MDLAGWERVGRYSESEEAEEVGEGGEGGMLGAMRVIVKGMSVWGGF